MPQILTGPILRYVGADEATIWLETDAPCEVEILGRRAPTFRLEGHHFALVVLRDLERATSTAYQVALDGRACWPPPGQPPSLIRTPAPDGPLTVVAGSCRRTAPETPPWTLGIDQAEEGLGPDALAALARAALAGDQPPPDLLVLAGDQVYSDLPSPATLDFIRARRPVVGEHDAETVDFEEYAFSYREAWGDPAVRWLLSTVSTAMVFDDHDVHNGWNSSQRWVEAMAEQPGWPARIRAGLTSYWAYQHLGNLAPDDLAGDEVWRAIEAGGDADAAVADVAGRSAGLRPGAPVRWSYRWDVGPVRLVVVDSRSARVLEEGRRDMLPESEWAWLESALKGGGPHRLVVTSVPVLQPAMVHHLEAWRERAGAGAWGRVGRALADRATDRLGLEHWPAFPRSFDRLLTAASELAAGRRGAAPASMTFLSGEVHYSYVAELDRPAGNTPVVQVVSSPLRNPSGRLLRSLHRFSTTAPAGLAARAVARLAGAQRQRWRWRLSGGLRFGNGLARFRYHDRHARVELVSPGPDGGLMTVANHRLSAGQGDG